MASVQQEEPLVASASIPRGEADASRWLVVGDLWSPDLPAYPRFSPCPYASGVLGLVYRRKKFAIEYHKLFPRIKLGWGALAPPLQASAPPTELTEFQYTGGRAVVYRQWTYPGDQPPRPTKLHQRVARSGNVGGFLHGCLTLTTGGIFDAGLPPTEAGAEYCFVRRKRMPSGKIS